MNSITEINLKKDREKSVFRRHLWIFSGAIHSKTGEPKNGDLVKILDSQTNFLAWGHYSSGSIAIRIVSFDAAQPDFHFWKDKIIRSLQMRVDLGLISNPENNNVFRWVHGEGDEMPGLIVDYYNGQVVIEMHSAGMEKLATEFAKIILNQPLVRVDGILVRSEEKGKNEILQFGKCVDSIEIIENGIKLKVDLVAGQKTGFFIDQRENRRLLGTLASGKTVLNTFCYTGGFSISALTGNAKWVKSVDVSSTALQLLSENLGLNSLDISKHETVQGDAIVYLKDSNPGVFDIIVLDPPAFAKHRSALKNAITAYTRLNQSAIEKVKSGGLILTFSCSQVVDKESFRQCIFTAAARTKKQVRILRQLQQPEDHPVNIFHPESEYLKGFLLQVE